MGSLRPYSWAKYWSEEGHEVDVATYSHDEDDPTNLNLKMTGFHVHEIEPSRLYFATKNFYQKHLKPSSHSSSVNKSQSKIFFKILLSNLWKKLKTMGLGSSVRWPDISTTWITPATQYLKSQNKTWDVVVSTFSPYGGHVVAKKLKSLGVAQHWIADFRDPWTDNHLFTGIPIIRAFEHVFEKRLLTHADLFSAVSPIFAKKLNERFQTESLTVPNGFDPSDLKNLDTTPIFPNDEYFRIVYTGNIYPGTRDPSPLFQAIQNFLTRNKNLKIKVIFVGGNVDTLIPLVQSYGIETYVEILPQSSREDSLRMQRDCDILLFLEKEGAMGGGVYPGKLYEYLFSGNPIWAVGIENTNSGTGHIIHSLKAGTCFGTNSKKIEEAIQQEIIERKSLSRVSSAQLDPHTRSHIAKSFLQKIESIVAIKDL